MGIFICSRCGGYGDSDDGCQQDILGKNGLICQACLEDVALDCDYCFEEIEPDKQDYIETQDGRLFHNECHTSCCAEEALATEEEQEAKVGGA